MSADFSIKAHDRLPSISATLSTAGSPVSLTGATVSFIMRPAAGGPPKVNAAATVDSAPGGTVHYDWLLVDTSTVGLYYGEWQVTFSSGKQQTFPTIGYHTIEVIQDLDNA